MQVDLGSLLEISGHGMKAQTNRMRVLAENIANSDTTGKTPVADPYRRKIPVFEDYMDKSLGINIVRAKDPVLDKKDFPMRYDPSHPAADASGYVKLPNVNGLMESMDMRQAQRSYEANLAVVDATRAMVNRTIDLLRV